MLPSARLSCCLRFSCIDPFTYLCFSVQFSSATVMAAKCAAHHEYSDFLIPQCMCVAPLVLAKVVFGLYGPINSEDRLANWLTDLTH